MKRVLFFTLICIMGTLVFSDDHNMWSLEMDGTLSLSQASFSNWKAGGDNSWSWQGDILAKANQEASGHNWNNTLKLSYGTLKQGSDEAKKTVDEIKLNSVYTFKPSQLYMSFLFLSQLTIGKDYDQTPAVEVSYFLDPMYFTESVGLEVNISQQFKTRYGGALKQTIVNKSTLTQPKSEVGGEFVAEYNQQVTSTLKLKANLKAFTQFKSLNEVDVDADVYLKGKITESINGALYINALYDKDLSDATQWRQTFALQMNFDLI